MQDIKVAAQFADHAGNQMHHKRVAIDFGQIRYVAATRGTDAGQIVTGQVNQHQMFRKLFVVGTHLQLNTAIEIAIQ